MCIQQVGCVNIYLLIHMSDSCEFSHATDHRMKQSVLQHPSI